MLECTQDRIRGPDPSSYCEHGQHGMACPGSRVSCCWDCKEPDARPALIIMGLRASLLRPQIQKPRFAVLSGGPRHFLVWPLTSGRPLPWKPSHGNAPAAALIGGQGVSCALTSFAGHPVDVQILL